MLESFKDNMGNTIKYYSEVKWDEDKQVADNILLRNPWKSTAFSSLKVKQIPNFSLY